MRCTLSTEHASSSTGLALIASGDDWGARALESVLAPAGYRVLRFASATEARERARTSRPDVILIATRLTEGDGEELCLELRHDPAVTPDTPIIGLTSETATRELRLRWLRAGAWDFLAVPFDVEELLVRVDAFVHAKRAADQARAGGLVDWATGLYSEPGLQRRARELVAEALRQHAALACVVFGPDARSPRPGGEAATPARPAARHVLGRLLLTHGRLSDTIGWWSGADFAVLAPATGPEGAELLAQRLAEAIETGSADSGTRVPAFAVRAGYHAVTDVHAAPLEPKDLLGRASAALALARSEARGRRIRRFEARD